MAKKSAVLSRLLALLLAAALLTGAPALAAETEGAAPSAAIYTTSNMSGRLYEQDPISGETESVSYLKVASAMALEWERVDSALLLDAGGAVSTGLTGDNGQAVALALRSIGYDALVPGVEEFRLGSGYCTDFIQTLESGEGETAGTPVDVLSANLLNAKDESPVTAPYQVYTLTLGDVEVRVGVLGLSGIDTPAQLPQRLYGDVLFSHSENQEASYLWEWNYWKSSLEQEDCDLVVVVCDAGRRTLEELAAATSGIDLIVGGGPRAETGTLRDGNGEPVSYVCGGGAALTRTTITLTEDGTPAIGSSSLLDLEEYENDGALAKLLSPYESDLKQAGLQRVGTLSGTWEDTLAASRQSDLDDLVGEALLWASGADAALISPGDLGQVSLASLFEKGSETAALTLADCAQIARNTTPVVTVELTGAQLRQWLEVCAGRYTVTAAGQPSGGEEADFLYGMDYELYLGSAEGSRVNSLTFQGEAVEDDQTFTVAVPLSRLSDPEFPRCTVVWSAAADLSFASRGGSTAALLAAYVLDAAHRSTTVTPARSSTWMVYPEAYNAPLTRLEFVELLYELAGRPQPGANYAFIDVTNSDAVIWAAETGVVSGDGRGKFLPLTVVTKEQAAVMIYNYVRRSGGEMPQVTVSLSQQLLDAAAVSSWAEPAVAFCLATDIIPTVGIRGDLFEPSTTVTRTEATAYLSALAEYLGMDQ